jgi:hypothetical protein
MIKSIEPLITFIRYGLFLCKTADKSMQLSKWVWLLLIPFLHIAEVVAQETQKLKFGLVAGPNFSWLKSRTPELDGRGAKVGFQYGLFADFAFKANPRYYFSSGVLFRHMYLPLQYNAADKIGTALLPTERSGVLSANYLYVPTALKMRTDEIGYSVFSGIFGLSTGFRLRGEESYDTQYLFGAKRFTGPLFERDMSDKLSAIVLSFDIGIEWERKISGNTYFTFGFQFNNGITNLLNMRGYAQNTGGITDMSLVLPNGEGQGTQLKANPRSLSLNFGIYF